MRAVVRDVRTTVAAVLGLRGPSFYKVYSSVGEDGVCHRGHGPVGYYGAETSDCDSPISLINATFDWVRDELKDSIDFVIWTGDSVRHDNDEKIPRNVQQVTQLNQLLVDKFYKVFGKDQQEPDDDRTNDRDFSALASERVSRNRYTYNRVVNLSVVWFDSRMCEIFP